MSRAFAIPDERLHDLRRAYEVEGLTARAVATRFGVSLPTAIKAVKRSGAVLRGPGPRRPAKALPAATPAQKPRAPTPKRRFTWHTEALDHVIMLKRDHAAIVERRTMFGARIVDAWKPDRVLKSGEHSRKIGGSIVKGAWRGAAVYTLTLQERATCSTSCHHFHTCMGNNMNWSERIAHGPDLERRLDYELELLQRRHPGGFVVRLHVLGDFYSPEYVARWLGWLDRFPALRVFGYTAWGPETPIGAAIAAAVATRWDRFAIRRSVAADVGGDWPLAVTAWTVPAGPSHGNAIVCPAQTGRTECCGTCGLCWATRRAIAFVVH